MALIAEQSLASSENHRMQPQLVLIDEVVGQQRLGQARATHEENRFARLAFEPRHLGATSRTIVVPFQSTLSNVVDATYLGRLFRARAMRLLGSVTFGQYSAQI